MSQKIDIFVDVVPHNGIIRIHARRDGDVIHRHAYQGYSRKEAMRAFKYDLRTFHTIENRTKKQG